MAVKVWLGFCCVDVVPSPKFQFQVVGEPVEVSTNWTCNGAGPLVGDAMNAAVNPTGCDPPKTRESTFMLPPWNFSVTVCRPAGIASCDETVVKAVFEAVFGTVTVFWVTPSTWSSIVLAGVVAQLATRRVTG